AQRKVEERNYSTRKHLLEWDEPMDFQRREFYMARQRILEERDLPPLIFDTIDETIETTLDQILGDNYRRTCIAEWCRSQIDLTVDEGSIQIDDLEEAISSVRQKAIDNAFDDIHTSIGEYIDPDEPPKQWDVGGLSKWAQRQYKFSISQNQLRRMEPGEIEDALIESARRHYESANLDGIALYLDPGFPHRALCEWAQGKFDVKVDPEELLDTPKQEVAELMKTRVRDAYYEREIAYPVETCLQRAFGQDSPDSAVAAGIIVQWTRHKFRVDWTLEEVQGRSVEAIREDLLKLNRSFFEGRLEEEVEKNIAGKPNEEIIEWAEKRFGRAWSERDHGDLNGNLKAELLVRGRELLRWELSKLEQFVLLRIYDQAWKDHLLEMDHLKSAIMQRPLGGDTAHPQSQFSIEGRDLFNQMWARISTRVTDIIFKVRASNDGKSIAMPQSQTMAQVHGDATGAGFAGAAADQVAAMRAQGTDGKVETIRREQPKVGRNAPCPCGSGKKYKQCHGKK
ncbi:MAG: SEC-C domain-containing protein, partial [Planctomycetes bacterium]|nr:SEC-C domain-containing protein [Planctomycetota bacterium]